MKYDFSEGFDAGPLAEQMSKFTPVPIPYSPPFDWAKYGTVAAIALGFVVALKFIGPIVTSRWTWAFGCVVTSLIMTSGYMFTKIRNSPWVARDGNWLASGFSAQFGQEVFVVAFVCAYPCRRNMNVNANFCTRWASRSLVPDAHPSRPTSKVACEAASAGLYLDGRHRNHILSLGLPLQGQKPWIPL